VKNLRSFVYGDLLTELKDKRYLAYCYMGSMRRGSLMYLNDDGGLTIITPSGYTIGADYFDEKDFNGSELWGFIHEMVNEEDTDIRQEAVNRYFDVYCNVYPFIMPFQNCQFITE
jgi:hypothetical protein